MAAPRDPDAPGPLLGVFGGTFDPPHLGHVTVAGDVADALALDALLWMPARISPHKLDDPPTPAPLRLEMVRAAAADDARFRVREDELGREGPSYTVDTLRALAAEHPGAELFVVMGADQVRAFGSWERPEEIQELARLAIMDRRGEDAPGALPGVVDPQRVVRVPITRVDVSSTAVRAAVAAGEDISGMVPAAVAEVIRREGLYR